MSERERFEAWANRFFAPVLIKRHADGENAGKYFGFCVEEAWYAWQAAKAEAAERERALVAEVELQVKMNDQHRFVNSRLGHEVERLGRRLELTQKRLDECQRCLSDVTVEALAQHEASKEASDE